MAIAKAEEYFGSGSQPYNSSGSMKVVAEIGTNAKLKCDISALGIKKSPKNIRNIKVRVDSGYSVIGYTGKLLHNFPDFLDSATRRSNFDSEQGETLLLPWKGRAHLRVLQDATQFRGRLNSHWSYCMTHTLP